MCIKVVRRRSASTGRGRCRAGVGEVAATVWEVDGYDRASGDTEVVAGVGRGEAGGGGCGGVVGRRC